MPVIHVWYIVEQGAPGLKQNAPLFQGVKDANALVRGTWGAAPADGLEPQDGDHVVEKMRMNAFYDTRLDILLRGLGVETLIITGAWTNMSIEHTARHAADAGYRAVVASDGTSTVNDEWQNAALNYAMTNVASVATCAEIAAALALGRVTAVATTHGPAAPGARVGLGRDVPGRGPRDRRDDRRGPADGRGRDAARDRARPRRRCRPGARCSRATARGSCAAGPT